MGLSLVLRVCPQVDAEFSNGRISDGWKISLSTLPWREGQTLDVASLFAPGASADSWEHVGSGAGQIMEVSAESLLARAKLVSNPKL